MVTLQPYLDMIAFPNSKINVGLYVTEKRPDGFHNLETVFYPLPFSDVLEILPDKNAKAGNVMFSSSGLKIPGNSNDNLCVKAYRLLEEGRKLPAIKMHLHKVIPTGAGLGGGSADGAFALRMLNEIFELGISKDELTGYARKMGSDCAFFLENRPIFANEKGDHFVDIELSLKGYWLVLAKPEVHVNTAVAYALITPEKPEVSLIKLVQQPLESWRGKIKNDFEKPIIQNNPDIEHLKTVMDELGAIYTCMSGSGSAVFGIFRDEVRVKDKLGASLLWAGRLN